MHGTELVKGTVLLVVCCIILPIVENGRAELPDGTVVFKYIIVLILNVSTPNLILCQYGENTSKKKNEKINFPNPIFDPVFEINNEKSSKKIIFFGNFSKNITPHDPWWETR